MFVGPLKAQKMFQYCFQAFMYSHVELFTKMFNGIEFVYLPVFFIVK